MATTCAPLRVHLRSSPLLVVFASEFCSASPRPLLSSASARQQASRANSGRRRGPL